MPMKRSGILFTIACIIFSLLLDSCHSSRKSAATKSHQPKFINSVAIAPHNRSNVTHNAIDPKKYKANPASRPVHQPVASTASIAGKPETRETPPVIRKKYAEIIGVKPKEINNLTLYQFIDKWYGTNYRLGGEDNTGIDCSGFARKLYDEVYGIDLSRTSREQFSDCDRVKKTAEAREGDLVFFHIHSKSITHVGVYLANNYFVHSSTTGGVMISSLNEEYWHKYYAGCGRVPRG